jgi:hypothetical protein
MANRGFFSNPNSDNSVNNPNIQVQKKKMAHTPSYSSSKSRVGGASSDTPVVSSGTTTITTTIPATTSTTTSTTTAPVITSTTTTTTTIHNTTTTTTTTTTSTTTTTTTIQPPNTLYMTFGISNYVYGSTFSLQTNCSVGSQNAHLPNSSSVGTLVYVYHNWPTMIQPDWFLEYNGVTYSIYEGINDTTDYSQVFLIDQDVSIPACSYITIIPTGGY